MYVDLLLSMVSGSHWGSWNIFPLDTGELLNYLHPLPMTLKFKLVLVQHRVIKG